MAFAGLVIDVEGPSSLRFWVIQETKLSKPCVQDSFMSAWHKLVIWEEETSVEKMPPLGCPVGESVLNCLD